ncbi:C-type lectin domain family 1 member B isoform X3 [Meriones unguiculatus]|uniref:C-type lectin domain family 1 member B isoform X3 n=1 Tax=Meriones unguiculatus TaxID=10047 RepID=UPI000B4E86DD|nr:C-type lectin domain family 1 member B isoform X2 [Meriones unguiculatus]XP_060240265.1 C-type lectin domain family 1 member B isoform X3 [Meriones unguiculatus]
MQDEDGYITLNIKPRKPALSSAVTQQKYLLAEKENLSATLQQLAKKFCQELIKHAEFKTKSSFGLHHRQNYFSPLDWIVTPEL